MSISKNRLAEPLEENPLALDRWLEALNSPGIKNDLLSVKSLTIIIRGLGCLMHLNRENDVNTTSVIRPILAKLALAYNSPRLLKEVGKVYLQDLHLIEPAQEHLEHAKNLGCFDPELPSLLKAVQTLLALKGCCTNSGVTSRAYANSAVGTIIRKTGQLSILREARVPVEPDACEAVENLSQDPAVCLSRAQEAIAIGNWGYAQKMLANVPLTATNKNTLWYSWTQIGEGLFGTSQFEEVEAAYRTACLIDPDSLISQFNWGVGLQMVHRYTEALEAYRRADLLEPNHPKVWCNIGSVHFLMENYNQAEIAWRRTVGLKKDYARAWDNLAAALGAQDKLSEAHTACVCALIYRSDFPECQFKLGVIYYSQRRFEKALKCLRLASAHPSLSVYTNSLISMAYSEMGFSVHAERALTLAVAAKSAAPEVLGVAWRALGRARMTQMEYESAIIALEESCRLQPANSQNWLDLGLAHQFMLEDEAAKKCFNRVLEIDQVRLTA